MQANRNPPDRRAPLAVRESVESRLGEVNEMKDFRRFEKPRDLKLSGAGPGPGGNFYDVSRKQQNVKMYKVRLRLLPDTLSLPLPLGGGPSHPDNVLRVV